MDNEFFDTLHKIFQTTVNESKFCHAQRTFPDQ